MQTAFEIAFLVVTNIFFLGAVGEKDIRTKSDYIAATCVMAFLDIVLLKLI